MRQQAIAFLEGMTGAGDGKDEAYIEDCIRSIMGQQGENTA